MIISVWTIVIGGVGTIQENRRRSYSPLGQRKCRPYRTYIGVVPYLVKTALGGSRYHLLRVGGGLP